MNKRIAVELSAHDLIDIIVAISLVIRDDPESETLQRLQGLIDHLTKELLILRKIDNE